jgi:hypothetical protein
MSVAISLKSIYLFLAILIFTNWLPAQESQPNPEELQRLKQRVTELEKRLEQLQASAVSDTSQSAKTAAAEQELEQELTKELGATQAAVATAATAPQTGARGGVLQNLNPNIGVIGNFIGSKVFEREEEGDGFTFEEAEFSFQMVIDPYAKADVFVAVVPPEEAVELEEGYITLLALPASLQARLGLFRPPFGKLNLTHPPETAFADQIPRVLNNFFGEEGLAETGVLVSALIPNPWRQYLEFSLGAFDGDNDVSFNGGATSDLLYFGHLKSFFDLSESSSIEFGLSGMTAKNDSLGDFRTNILGADFIYRWKPPRLNRYKSFTLQSEFLYSRRKEAAGDIKSWGMFAFAQQQLSKRFFLGGRFDYSEFPTSSSDREIAYSAILTFWPSEFQTIRLQYRHLNRNFADDDNTIFLQWVFITGAHGAHQF